MPSSLETISSCCPQVGRNGHDGSQEENEVIGVSGNEMVSLNARIRQEVILMERGNRIPLFTPYKQ